MDFTTPTPDERPDRYEPADPPQYLISLALEAAPRVYMDAQHEGDELRLKLWIDSQPALRALVDTACELERAA